MKSFFKRSAISIVVLGMAGSAYAAVPVPVYNYDNWSPSFTGAFIGVEGLDLRPLNGDLDYVTVIPNTPNTANIPFNTNAINTSYDWGWRVYGGIKFSDQDDITLSWMQLRTSDNNSTFPTGTISGILGVSTPRMLFDFPWDSVQGHVSFDLDDAYAVWGHTINFNNPWSVRFAAGVEYAKIDSDLTVSADGSTFFDVPNLALMGFTSNSSLKGFGPRVEFDMTYHLPYGFALFGNANAALLVSNRDISLNPVNASVFIPDIEDPETFTFFNSNFSTRHVVVPKFGARLGASYTYVWGQVGAEGIPCQTTSLTIDAGWQVESYIHAIERIDEGFVDTGIEPGLQPSSVTSLASTKVSNFGDSGFFIGIKLGTDWL